MARYFLKCSYNGTDYNGWQIQPHTGTSTVQGKLQEKFSLLTRNHVELVGCGRTDTGVHARGYIAHFDIEGFDYDLNDVIYKLNKMLPKNISIEQITLMHQGAHARFDPISRSYHYHLHTEKDPFAHFSFHYIYGKPSLETLNKAASLLTKYDAFLPFCKANSDNLTNICKIQHAEWIQDGDKYTFKITSDRFLRGMIRLIVGMCLNVDRSRLTLEQVEEALQNQTRLPEDWSVPGHGLILTDIIYPYPI